MTARTITTDSQFRSWGYIFTYTGPGERISDADLLWTMRALANGEFSSRDWSFRREGDPPGTKLTCCISCGDQTPDAVGGECKGCATTEAPSAQRDQ